MGDMDTRIIPLSDPAKAKADVISIGTVVGAWFKAIPWPEIAACLAAIYTLLRIIELAVGWFKKKRR